ncbi:glycosyltransferase [Limnohabitans sp. Jir72]|uniref:glycosyltransferase n=1 Tax=Limnohabitans sp. Jir72 TaxID=1977909 RepID=UPI000D3513AE|nr:glycosyltransferase [Limnohabitans sp. Jir72]PUE35636.1 hypothetical protein B9Z52_00120 [Limnohabitans sp. Jir72]
MSFPNSPPLVVFVCATRLSVDDFWLKAPLGQSLTRLQGQGVAFALELAAQNASPLATLYNKAIAHRAPEQILVFIHDDVRLDDLFIADRLVEGLAVFDVIGVAGNRRLKPRQGAWAFAEKMGQWDHAHNLLGGINHELPDRANGFSRYGPTRTAARVLDGVFLAARAGTLRLHKVQFAPELAFHLYDMEFCQRAHRAGLRMGVWPIAMTHFSGGQYDSDNWKQAYKTYCQFNWPTPASKHKDESDEAQDQTPTPDSQPS